MQMTPITDMDDGNGGDNAKTCDVENEEKANDENNATCDCETNAGSPTNQQESGIESPTSSPQDNMGDGDTGEPIEPSLDQSQTQEQDSDNPDTCPTEGDPSTFYKPRYKDAFSMRYGLFIHWAAGAMGQGTGIVDCNGKSIGIDVDRFAETIDVEAVADQIQDLGFEYVILTDFHGIGSMLHPCDASDRWRGFGYATNDLDIVGDLIKALQTRGIGFILFTHPLDGHDYPESQREMLGWNDPTDGYKVWNDFVNDVYAELTDCYGEDIMGIGFDSDFGLCPSAQWKDKLDLPRLRETILSRAPHLQLYALAGPNDCCELGMKELWRPNWHDPWQTFDENDWDVEGWPAYRRVIAVVQANHWATITPRDKGVAHLNATQMYRYSVLQAAAATEGPGVAWAASPYADGSWENHIRETFEQVVEMTKDVQEAIKGVYPSTAYPTPEGMKMKELPHGIVATKSTDDSMEYIHVLYPPEGKSLVLPFPEDGKDFATATLLATGNPVEISEVDDDLILTLGDDDEWDEVNTVIALEVASCTPVNLALHKRVIYSTSVDSEPNKWPPKSDHGAIRLTDGQCHAQSKKSQPWSTGNLGWSSKPSTEETGHWVGVDLEEPLFVSSVVLYPRDDCGHEREGFPNEFSVEVSLNEKEDWTCVAKSPEEQEIEKEGNENDDDSGRRVSFDPVTAQYVRVCATGLPKDSTGLCRMELTQLKVF